MHYEQRPFPFEMKYGNNFNDEGFAKIGQKIIIQVLNYLCQCFDNMYCHHQDLCTEEIVRIQKKISTTDQLVK